jgi:hypothetical protein
MTAPKIFDPRMKSKRDGLPVANGLSDAELPSKKTALIAAGHMIPTVILL